MATIHGLAVDDELDQIRRLAEKRGWTVSNAGATDFVVGMTAKDGQHYWLRVVHADYPAFPPAWHWFNAETGQMDVPCVTPKGSDFIHGSGVICAPWNRLAYRSEDPRGPHGEWAIGDWRGNQKTGACTTLPEMALRIYVELQGAHYHGRTSQP